VTEIARNPSAWRDTVLDTRTDSHPSEVMNPTEMEAMKRAGRDAGSYLVGLSKTDMRNLTGEEWTMFSSVMILGYELHLAGLRDGTA